MGDDFQLVSRILESFRADRKLSSRLGILLRLLDAGRPPHLLTAIIGCYIQPPILGRSDDDVIWFGLGFILGLGLQMDRPRGLRKSELLTNLSVLVTL
jgi:hypothetical protein